MPTFITDNPAAFTGVLRGFLMAALGLGAAFGLHLSPDQQSAILNFTVAAIALASFVSIITVKATVPKTPSSDAGPASMQALPPLPDVPTPPPAP